MTRFCPNCDREQETRVVKRVQSLVVRGEDIEVDADVVVCTGCGEDIFDPSYDNRILKQAYDAYRERHGLLTSREIRELRERYGLSQRSLAKLLGWGLVTIQRYEQGALQDKAHDAVLRSLMDPQRFLLELERSGDRLPERIREEARQRAIDANRVAQPQMISRQVERMIKFAYETDPLLCGLRPFQLDRLGELVGWIATRCGDLFKTKLAKLLWLVDFAHFRLHRVSVTGLVYSRLPHGPAPHRFQMLLGILEEIGVIRLVECTAGPYEGEIIEPGEKTAGLDGSTESERHVIETVVDRFGHRSSAELSRMSHCERVWTERKDGEPIPYSEADEVRMLDQIE